MPNKKRIEWIDILKYISIMCLMLTHLESKTKFLHAFYTPFALTAFFFASGYVYNNRYDFRTFIIKKIKGLFVPWLFFSVFNILLSQILTFNEHSSLKDELKWNFFQIRGLGDGMWFVAALFVAFIPFYFFIKYYEDRRKYKSNVIVLLISSFFLSLLSNLYNNCMSPDSLPWGGNCLPWHLEYIFIAMFWMILGYLFKDKFEKIFDEKIDAVVKNIMIIVYLIIIYIPYFSKFEITNIAVSIIYSYLSSFIGLFALIHISKMIKPNKYFLYIGQNTLICFALHGKFLSLIQSMLKRFVSILYSTILDNTFFSSIFAMLFTFLISFILIIPIYIINRWFPFLIGRYSCLSKNKDLLN